MGVSQVYSPQSLDASIDVGGEEGGLNLSDLIGVEDDNYSDVEFYDFVQGVSEELSEAEKIILRDRYFDKKTQVSIAEKLNVSQMTISRMEKKIIEKFRKSLEESLSI